MFRVWSPQPSIAVSPLADFTPSPNTRRIATRSACYRGPKPKTSQVVRSGCKGVLASWGNGLPRVSCTNATQPCFEAMQPSFAPMQQALFGPHSPIRQSLMPVILLPAILGPEMAAPILWAPGIFGSFCWRPPCPENSSF